jgi:3-phenylpropionate/trans-cinnamate dioxygenase ferredoxin component
MAFEAVGLLDDIEVGQAVKIVIGDVPVAVARVSVNEAKAVHNTCSHQQFDLAPEGWVEGCRIECSLHGSTFDLNSGEPDALPATQPIPVYAARIENGIVYVDVQQQLNNAPVPRYTR